MSINKTTNTPAAKPPVQAKSTPAPTKPAANNAPAIANDSFDFNKPPSAQKLADARAAVALLATVKPIPLADKQKDAWLADAQQIHDKAAAGAKVLEDAAFFTKSVPDAEADKAREALFKLEDQIQQCKDRKTTGAGFYPLNPFRPLNQFQKGITGQMDNPLGAIIGVVTLPVAITLDIVDMVTRPVQVVAYPFEWAAYGIKKAGSKLFGVS
jgi:hypothetical protein